MRETGNVGKENDLSDWGIENPLRAILLEQPLGYLK